AFVLDDGFQHRRAKRDVDIVCIDAANPFGNEKVLPAGILREPLENLRRGDVIVLTRPDLADDLKSLRQQIAALTTAPVFECRTRLDQILSLQDFQKGNVTTELSTKKMFAFCGLGNPADFLQTVGEQFDLAGSKSFRDHHAYSQADIEMIEGEAVAAGAKALVTTGKDAVKLSASAFKLPCFVASISIEIDKDAAFLKML
ncbi:MAG TPA: tetraacyldisaccharide 4'-kinase, partial [Pyrinomonadaceae bacterium]|nr:tetraacyldisaccharide 4'-kinase [Pyrinomonadaceae bacterium]